MHKSICLLAACVVLAACSTPRCPQDLIQLGNICRRCPEGSEKQGNECVSLDGGRVVGPVTIDGDEMDVDDATLSDSGSSSDAPAAGPRGSSDGGASSGEPQDAWSTPEMDAGSKGSSPQPNSEGGAQSQVDSAAALDSSLRESGAATLDSQTPSTDTEPYTGLPQQSFIKPPEGRANDRFGSSLALLNNRLVVGAPGHQDPLSGTQEAGSAYVFTQVGGQWIHQGALAGTFGGVPSRHFGKSVAISDGWVAVGGDRLLALYSCAAGPNHGVLCQARTNFAPPAGSGSDPTDTSFASSVALTDTIAVVGAPTYHQRAADGASYLGNVFVYSYSTGAWEFAYEILGELNFTSTPRGMEFGAQVAAANSSIAIGAPDDWRNASGSVSAEVNLDGSGTVFVYSSGDSGATRQARLKASNSGARDRFGSSVALYQDTLVVGAPGESSSGTNQASDDSPDAGAVYIFIRSNTSWTQQAYIKAPRPQRNDRFGTGVAVWGDALAVGAPGTNGGAGSVFIYRRSNAQWTYESYLQARTRDSSDRFGWTVATSSTNVTVGAPGESSASMATVADESDNGAPAAGSAYAYRRSM